ncbi:tripartite tricarboxylate transporter substrate binding protein [Lentisphaera araneosa]|uniref:tripartite tricarboxylate transporter substrate binding protein n=1 Tax=Lentisphaera araneosa TaxID=256847 RepID=UPI001EE66ED2|nr:tripartite tricarboxylate transporter substrate binding protein [Lentisphaera araneosa]
MIRFIFILIFLGLSLRGEDSNSWPQRPVKVIVPFGAGGGSDTFARQLTRVIKEQDLLSQPMVVINVGGAGGTIGSRRVRYARPDGYTMLMLHEGILTAKHAGKASYGAEAFEAVAGTGETAIVVAVKDNSKYHSLKDLMLEAKLSPNTLNFAANLGAPSHFIGLILEKSLEGAMFNFVQYGGGAERYGAIMGEHVDMSIFSVEEYLRYKDGGLKALAVCSAERHLALPELSTVSEQGFELETSNMHFWWMPKGTSQAIQKIMADVISQAMKSEDMQNFMKASWIDPVVMQSEELRGELIERDHIISKVAIRKVDVLPNFELWIFGIVAVLGLFAFDKKCLETQGEKGRLWNPKSCKVFLLTFVYVFVLSTTAISYPLLTVFFLFALGFIIADQKKVPYLPLSLYSLVLSFGLFYLFTRVLVVDLPG